MLTEPVAGVGVAALEGPQGQAEVIRRLLPREAMHEDQVEHFTVVLGERLDRVEEPRYRQERVGWRGHFGEHPADGRVARGVSGRHVGVVVLRMGLLGEILVAERLELPADVGGRQLEEANRLR